jgi:hypothetical protein
VKPGKTQTILIIGPKRSSVEVQLLWTDDLIDRRKLKLDAKGRGSLDVKVRRPSGHPRTRTVTVQVLAAGPSGTAIAIAHFHNQ